MRKNLVELVGTFLLCSSIVFATSFDGYIASLIIGSVLLFCIYFGGMVSDANYNLVVSLGLYFNNKINASTLIGYVAAQLTGGLAGTTLARATMGTTLGGSPVAYYEYSLLIALFAEIVGTFLLVYFVLWVSYSKFNFSGAFKSIGIAACVSTLSILLGSYSGGAYNLAVGLSWCFNDYLNGGNYIQNLALYTIGPSIGGITAALLFKRHNDELGYCFFKK